MSNEIRIAVVDDHPIFCAGLKRTFGRVKDMTLVAMGGSASDALRIAKQEQPDILLLDVTMPGCGLAAAGAIKELGLPCQVIILTGSDDDGHLASAFAAGARGYVLKGSTSAELIDAVRTVHSGQPYVTSTLSTRILVHAARKSEVASNAATHGINARERQILEFASQGLTNQDIAVRLGLALPTVRNYMSAIFDKLQVRNRAEAVAVWLKD